jgi:hypothetical protein
VSRDKTCFLCNETSPNVTPGLVAWIEPVGKQLFTFGPRCRDVAACRERVGAEWDVRVPERTTAELIAEAQR